MSLEMTLNFEQDAFLTNIINKQHFIELLIPILRQSGIDAQQSHADADTDIVSSALQMAQSPADNEPLVVYAGDTDILALLVCFPLEAIYDRHISLLRWKRRCNDGDKCMNICKVQEKFGSDISCQILVLHAFGGCDTTSAII